MVAAVTDGASSSTPQHASTARAQRTPALLLTKARRPYTSLAPSQACLDTGAPVTERWDILLAGSSTETSAADARRGAGAGSGVAEAAGSGGRDDALIVDAASAAAAAAATAADEEEVVSDAALGEGVDAILRVEAWGTVRLAPLLRSSPYLVLPRTHAPARVGDGAPRATTHLATASANLARCLPQLSPLHMQSRPPLTQRAFSAYPARQPVQITVKGVLRKLEAQARVQARITLLIIVSPYTRHTHALGAEEVRGAGASSSKQDTSSEQAESELL